MGEPQGEAFDYVVVGSGAGGGTVAARLAEAGMSVLLLEAGRDSAAAPAPGLPEDYDVPAFHPFASENKAMAWNYRVHDFGDDADRRAGTDACGRRGVLYPRASTLGGCTAHNAMILMAPPDSDWNAIADLTGDSSWRAAAMRRYFQRLENCRHRPLWRFIARITGGRVNPTGHGWDGWLDVEVPTPVEAFGDRPLVKAILSAIAADLDVGAGQSLARFGAAIVRLIERNRRFLIGEDDPNDWRLQGRLAEGLTLVPLATRRGRRRGARERVRDAIKAHGLSVEFEALATRVLIDERLHAVGVEYRKGRDLYRARPEPASAPADIRRVFARREVILAAGAFNTPQLLMLSGVGPVEELSRRGIDVRVALDGVGRNLQDRYEIGIVHRTHRPWECLDGIAFEVGDAAHRQWEQGRGMYRSNGAAVAFSLRSAAARVQKSEPDLFVMALVTRFTGYFTGYSDLIRKSRGDLSFVILKAHTNNRGGRVSLFSADPRDPPAIDFSGFEEGTDVGGEDLDAVVEGVERVRGMARKVPGILEPEDTPGADCDGADRLKEFVRRHAWGHHASCTCPIGPKDAGGVLTSDFRVHGVYDLRVVDASVFPRIPGFFIVCAIYMVAEKAAEVILDAASAKV
ncbi:MAG: GMC family oxidoreductase [Hyphomicrobiales bacterium]|nr:GMC family oxidoreductase [Hyphomicrobiales bacterium]MBV8440472.1 GMC family oxidoreductase [Hyphomicrobiales bacterium]